MASHTICCTCGNIIKLANAIAGAKTVCSRCQKVWTVPAQAAQGQAPAPSPRRPVVVKKKSSSAGTVGVVLFLAAAVGGGLFFALKDNSPSHALFGALSLCALSILICVAFLTWMRRATA